MPPGTVRRRPRISTRHPLGHPTSRHVGTWGSRQAPFFAAVGLVALLGGLLARPGMPSGWSPWLPPLWDASRGTVAGEMAPPRDARGLPLLLAPAPPESGGWLALAPVAWGSQKPFTLREEGITSPVRASGATVGEALRELAVPLGPADLVLPQPPTPLTPGLLVYVKYARALTVAVDGDHLSLYTHRATVGEALGEAQLSLSPADRVDPEPSARVSDGMQVVVTRVREERKVEQTAMAPRTVYRYDPSLPPGETRRVPGRAGVFYQEVAARYEDERLVSRLVTREWWNPERQDTVILWGDEEAWAGGDCVATMTVFATWYNPASAGKPITSPGYGITATGVPVRKGIVAVDPRVIPLGSRLFVPGYGLALAADTGGAVKGNIIDLGYPDGVAVDWTSRWVEACLLG